jgi:hypothetical protein
MDLPDITQYTEAQWDQLIASLQQAKVTKEIERQQAQEALKTSISGVTTELRTLIGPDNPTTPSMGSLTEVQKYTGDQMVTHARLALPLIFEDIEKLARAVENLAAYVAGRPEQ